VYAGFFGRDEHLLTRELVASGGVATSLSRRTQGEKEMRQRTTKVGQPVRPPRLGATWHSSSTPAAAAGILNNGKQERERRDNVS